MIRARAPSRARRAASVVEAALVLPLMLLFLLGLFEYCRFVFLVQVCENAVREGARYAAARTGDGTAEADIKNLVKAKMAGRLKELPDYDIQVLNVNPATGAAIPGTVWSDAPFGGAILVRLTGTYTPKLPGFLKTRTSIPVRATAMMTSEAN